MEKIEDLSAMPEFERDLLILEIITENSLNELKTLIKLIENSKANLSNLNDYEVKKSYFSKIFAIKELNEKQSNQVRLLFFDKSIKFWLRVFVEFLKKFC